MKDLASALKDRGNYAKSLEYFQRSLADAETINDKGTVCQTLCQIGTIHQAQGNLKQALDYFDRSYSLCKAIDEKISVALVLSYIGLVHQAENRYEEAAKSYQESLAIAEQFSNRSVTAAVLTYLASLNGQRKKFDEATTYLERALTLSEKFGDMEAMANALIEIGNVKRLTGKHDEALLAVDRGAAIAKDRDLPALLAQARTIAGEIHRELKQTELARSAFEDAVGVVENLRSKVVGEEQRQHFLAQSLTPYHRLIEVLIESRQDQEALLMAERARARVLVDVLQTGKVDIDTDLTPEEKQKKDTLTARITALNSQVYTERIKSLPDESRVNSLETELQKTRMELEAVTVSQLASRPDSERRLGRSTTITKGEIAALITKDTAIIHFAVTKENVFVFVLRKGEQNSLNLIVKKVAVTPDQLSLLCRRFHYALASRSSEVRALGIKLYDVLLRPIRNELVSKANLIIVPDGPLWEVSFQALQSSANRYLIEDAAISYAPSITALREMRRAANSRVASGAATALVAFGDPIVSDKTSSTVTARFMDSRLLPLPDSARQVLLLKRLYGRSSRVYVGPSASEVRAKAEVGDSRIIHFATHGIFNDSSPMYSQIVLANPSEESGQDGLLEAWEIMNLKLKADLVVLSACETARGRISAGEGVIGMTWACFVAGAPALIASQWKVESGSTTEFMLAMHRTLLRQRNKNTEGAKAAALREAALSLLRTRRYNHPFYWAPFILVGAG